MSPSEDCPALVPDDLLRVEEANAEQPVQHFACTDTGMPYVRNLLATSSKASDQWARVSPEMDVSVWPLGPASSCSWVRPDRSRSDQRDRSP
jgi:hypothetical protein